MYHCFHKNIKKHSNYFQHVSWAANQYIRMISERSCDTEDWSDDNYINKSRFKIETSYLKL